MRYPSSTWVYPRACGGTQHIKHRPPFAHGLSPRVRGNPVDTTAPVAPVRSIPARAGEPAAQSIIMLWDAVYPRACGGTQLKPAELVDGMGLSPRVRGNPTGIWPASLTGRSIPARAGEPRPSTGAECRRRVYPRACGGTTTRHPHRPSSGGLSPRVRGNHDLGKVEPAAERSIPARAGEPRQPGSLASGVRVYPRACGGTDATPARLAQTQGLSPRVRGNRASPDPWHRASGSIPARAGEP